MAKSEDKTHVTRWGDSARTFLVWIFGALYSATGSGNSVFWRYKRLHTERARNKFFLVLTTVTLCLLASMWLLITAFIRSKYVIRQASDFERLSHPSFFDDTGIISIGIGVFLFVSGLIVFKNILYKISDEEEHADK